MGEALSLAWSALSSPSACAERCRRKEAAAPGAWIYLAYTVATAVFLAAKPAGFPDAASGALEEPARDAAFWIKMILVQPPVEAAWILFLMGLARLFSGGSWPVRFSAAVAWTAAPFICLAAYTNGALPKPGLALALVVWSGSFWIPARSASASEWREMIVFMLALNAIGVVLTVPMAAAAWARQPVAFQSVQAAGGLWILGAATLGLRRLTALRLPRAFMAVILSVFLQIGFVFNAYLLGWVPREVLKALFYA